MMVWAKVMVTRYTKLDSCQEIGRRRVTNGGSRSSYASMFTDRVAKVIAAEHSTQGTGRPGI